MRRENREQGVARPGSALTCVLGRRQAVNRAGSGGALTRRQAVACLACARRAGAAHARAPACPVRAGVAAVGTRRQGIMRAAKVGGQSGARATKQRRNNDETAGGNSGKNNRETARFPEPAWRAARAMAHSAAADRLAGTPHSPLFTSVVRGGQRGS